MSSLYSAGLSETEAIRAAGGRAVVKLSANENPLGTSPAAVAALRNLGKLNLYFDETHEQLRAKIADRFGLESRNIVLGHGSNEVIAMIVRAYLSAGDEAVMAAPTFSLYRAFTATQGAIAVQIPLQHGVHDIEAMCGAITARTRVVFICDPNNPTGTALTSGQWTALLDHLPAHVLLAVDQAYLDYSSRQGVASAALIQRPNTIVLRTMSKIYGLAALRFGYAYSSTDVIQALNVIRVPYNVSLPAAVAAEAALDDAAFVARSVRVNAEGKAFLAAGLQKIGLHVFPSEANFLSVAVPITADTAYAELLANGILVRSGDSLAMPGRLRVSVGTVEDLKTFLDVLQPLFVGWRR